MTKKVKTSGHTGNIKGSTERPSLKRKRTHKDVIKDDTPRAFARLMAFQQGTRVRSGLDDGIMKSKKQQRADAATSKETMPPISTPESIIPKIKPGERMAEYSARVDAALPVSGLIGKGTRGVKELPGVKKQRTKMERKMHRMYKEWREVDAKRKEQEEEAREEAEEEEMENGNTVPSVTSKLKKGKKRKGIEDDSDEDPWAAVGKNRKTLSTPGGLVGLHDVVQAPPKFTKVPKEKFRILNGAKVDVLDVPGSAGSLRRREELGQARRSVVEGYRQMMRDRRALATE